MLNQIFKKIAAALLGLFLLVCQAAPGGAENLSEAADWGRVLIVYYSHTGNTRELAAIIQQHTGGVLYDLQTVQSYPPVPELYQTAKRELTEGKLPELNPDWPDLSQYDVIFAGSPVWWYTVSSPMLSFLSQADFQGRLVAPFCSHGGNYGAFFQDFKQSARNARLLPGLDYYGRVKSGDAYPQSKVRAWLTGLQAQLAEAGR